jgi:osmotically-inducible protein OsmY
MKDAGELRRDVLEELEFEPSLDAASIGVAADEGVVTLTGHVPTYAERITAERAVKRVGGVRGVANDLTVELWPGTDRDDTAIAQAALNALEWNTLVPDEAITVTVDNGWVTLEGEVEWKHQADAAFTAVANLSGVRGVSNLVTLRPRVYPTTVEKRIRSAFQRSASLDANRVHVETVGSRVILRGVVRSWAEHEDAERAAWAVPGVTMVENELMVSSTVYADA